MSVSPAAARSPLAPTMTVLALGAWALAFWFTMGGSRPADAFAAGEVRAADVHLLVQQDGQWWTVEVSMLIYDDQAGNFEQAAAEARATMLARFPGAIELDEQDGSVSGQYALNAYSWAGGATSWAYNSDGEPGGLSGAQGAIQAGADIWGQVGADWSFSGGGSSSAGTGACGGSLDGDNTVGWAPQSGSTLGVTCTWYNQSLSATEFDMEIDPAWGWTTGAPIQIDLQSVATHEFGHALGLGHSSQSSAVMYASYGSGQDKRTPQQDDVDGVIAKYGSSGGGGPTPTEEPSPDATETPTPSNTPTPSPTATPTSSGAPGDTPTPTPPGEATPTNTPTTGPNNPTPSSTPTPTRTPSATATPTRTPVPPPSLGLLPGINFVAWPGETAAPGDVLGGMGDVIQVVYSWDPILRRWERYAPGLPAYVNSLQQLKKGEAYWLIASKSSAISVR